MKSSQRFIAGASCPSCQSMDSLLLNQDDQSIQCVDCSYIETSEDRDKKLSLPTDKNTDVNAIDIKIIKN